MYRDLEIPIHELVEHTLPCRINGTLGMAYLFNSVLVLEVSSSPSPLAFQALSALLSWPVLNTRQTTRGTARPWASTALAQQDTPRLIEHQLLKDSTPAECGVGARNPRLHYRLLTLCPAPTDPVDQSWPCVCTYVCMCARAYVRVRGCKREATWRRRLHGAAGHRSTVHTPPQRDRIRAEKNRLHTTTQATRATARPTAYTHTSY